MMRNAESVSLTAILKRYNILHLFFVGIWLELVHLCKLRTFTHFLLMLPDLNIIPYLVEYSYLFPQIQCENFTRKKQRAFPFNFTFCKRGKKSLEIGIIEGAITSILEHYKAHFDL